MTVLLAGGLAQIPSVDPRKSLADALRRRVRGDVRFDALARTLYATDASIYEIVPAGVVCPRDIDDVIVTIEECGKHGTSIVPRGAGTGLTGGAVGTGVQLDLSRHMHGIGAFDRENRTIEVEPGVVLDHLNAHVAPHGIHFAPDVATSSRATLGGMIANNSCGAHSIIYGRTVDHLAELTVVLANGELATFTDPSNVAATSLVKTIDRGLMQIVDHHRDEIIRRFPKVLRSNSGYGLDRLLNAGEEASAVRVLCGSEGTLAVTVGAKLRLSALPKRTGLVVVHFDELGAALGATPRILEHAPAAVELVDDMIIQAALHNRQIAQRCGFLRGMPAAILIVEFHADHEKALESAMARLVDKATALEGCRDVVSVIDPAKQSDVWNLRKAGLGLLMSRPGDRQPHAFVEDSAVDPAHLQEYIRRFGELLKGEGVDAGYYAHASVGCIHVRPIVNLKDADDVRRMHRIADAVSGLALEFGGAMTGEHGDGIVRSCWIEKVYGPHIVEAFREVKNLFDPENLFNPHKIVDPWPMTEHLRFGSTYRQKPVKTYLDFDAYGGMAGLAEMCSGVGQCRQRFEGVMCPSYMATRDEKDTTRARANALRVALSNQGLLDGLDDPQLAEVMDLCIACKACKTQCPTGVDMARMKAEFLSYRNRRFGVPRRARFVADVPKRLAIAGQFPRLVNFMLRLAPVRHYLERRFGWDARIDPTPLAHRSFRKWFDRHRQRRGYKPADRGRVVYLVDTWTNYFHPEVGVAAVRLLESAGYEVLCPATMCCGRPAISQGLLGEAKRLAEFNIGRLAPLVQAGVPVVGTEPSCTLTLVDEYPQLVRTDAARQLASQTMMLETLLCRTWADDMENETFADQPVLYHGHCHQKAIVGTDDAMQLLRIVAGDQATEIQAGCCGMAGGFGHEKQHYEIARAIGEDRLFPAVRDRQGAHVLVSGFSCRQQIQHHTDVHPQHLAEFLAERIAEGP